MEHQGNGVLGPNEEQFILTQDGEISALFVERADVQICEVGLHQRFRGQVHPELVGYEGVEQGGLLGGRMAPGNTAYVLHELAQNIVDDNLQFKHYLINDSFLTQV